MPSKVMRTQIVIRVTDIEWGVDEDDKRRRPAIIRVPIDDLCDIEDSIRNGEDVREAIETQVGQALEEKYDAYPDSFEWSFNI